MLSVICRWIFGQPRESFLAAKQRRRGHRQLQSGPYLGLNDPSLFATINRRCSYVLLCNFRNTTNFQGLVRASLSNSHSANLTIATLASWLAQKTNTGNGIAGQDSDSSRTAYEHSSLRRATCGKLQYLYGRRGNGSDSCMPHLIETSA